MAKSPSFQGYPGDCDTNEDVKAMDDAEFGFYMRCLNHAWLNDGLPADFDELARVMGKTKKISKDFGQGSGKFLVHDGRFVNPRQEKQRSSARDLAGSKRSAAKARWDKRHVQRTSNAIQNHIYIQINTHTRLTALGCSMRPKLPPITKAWFAYREVFVPAEVEK